jgi:methionyl-tRNA synthetase
MKKQENFYISTPIYYVNWLPHVWHFYSSIIANILAKYNKINWKRIKFTTWVDENSQKSIEEAKKEWLDIMEYLDKMTQKHKLAWNNLDINYTDFVRTTEKRHHNLVKEVLQKTYDNDDIYMWKYEWMYCVWCEAFKKDTDLIEKNWKKVCPDHLSEPSKIKEKNYFFRLSKYGDKLLKFYEENPNFVTPSDRFNEVKAFVKKWLDDFSISRETNKFGIKLPFDESQVTYVWYDALFNYITSCKYSPVNCFDEKNPPNPLNKGENNEEFFQDKSEFWPADLHVVWKDIIRFHAIYWPAMLMSIWYKPPKQILTTWFFTVDWQKMSKSLGNVIDPVEYSKKFSLETLILYLLSSFNIWQDWNFDQKQAILMYNAKLANNLWNLVNRVVVLNLKLEGPHPNPLPKGEGEEQKESRTEEEEQERNSSISFLTSKEKGLECENLLKRELNNKYENILNDLDIYKKTYTNLFKNYNLKWILDETFSFLDKLNKFIDKKEPWNLIKKDKEQTKEILYITAEWLRQTWLCLYSFFPKKMWEMFKKLWLESYIEKLENWDLKELVDKNENFYIKEKWNNLFDRISVD